MECRAAQEGIDFFMLLLYARIIMLYFYFLCVSLVLFQSAKLSTGSSSVFFSDGDRI